METKNLLISLGLIAGVSAQVYAEPETMHKVGAPAAEVVSEPDRSELVLKRKTTLSDLKAFMMTLERKNLSMEKMIAAMNVVLTSRNAQEMSAEEHAQWLNTCNTLKTLIAYNMLKLERAKEDLRIQQEFSAFITDNLDNFLQISGEVGKVMSARYE